MPDKVPEPQRAKATAQPHNATARPGDEAARGTPGTGEDLCPECNGTGRSHGAVCPNCNGSGKITRGIGGG